MLVVIVKSLTPLFSPLGMCLLAWVGALILYLRGYHGVARAAALFGIGVILLFSNPIVGDALIRSLEEDYEAREPERYPTADAIVVLGGVTKVPVPPRVGIGVAAGFDRLRLGVQLLKARRAPLLILSGGSISALSGSDVPEADRLRSLALEYGVDDRAMLLERSSRNTHENAVLTGQLLSARGIERIILVTSASHMGRAEAAFQQLDVEIVPAPTDFEAVPKPMSVHRLLPGAVALLRSTRASKEYLGLLFYKLVGWA